VIEKSARASSVAAEPANVFEVGVIWYFLSCQRPKKVFGAMRAELHHLHVEAAQGRAIMVDGIADIPKSAFKFRCLNQFSTFGV
jgi:hypothetical protein